MGNLRLGIRLFYGWNILFNNPHPKLIVHTLIHHIFYNSFTIIAFFIGFIELKKRNNVKGKWVMYCSIALFIITFIVFWFLYKLPNGSLHSGLWPLRGHKPLNVKWGLACKRANNYTMIFTKTNWQVMKKEGRGTEGQERHSACLKTSFSTAWKDLLPFTSQIVFQFKLTICYKKTKLLHLAGRNF